MVTVQDFTKQDSSGQPLLWLLPRPVKQDDEQIVHDVVFWAKTSGRSPNVKNALVVASIDAPMGHGVPSHLLGTWLTSMASEGAAGVVVTGHRSRGLAMSRAAAGLAILMPCDTNRTAVEIYGQLLSRRSDLYAEAEEVTLQQAGVQALLNGEIATAQDILSPIVPELLTAQGVQVGVIRVATHSDRHQAWQRCERALAGRALAVPHPRDASEVLILRPMGDSSGGFKGELASLLRELFPSTTDMKVGIGQPIPLRHALEGRITALQHLQPPQDRGHAPDRPVSPLWMRLAGTPEAQGWTAAVNRSMDQATADAPAVEHLLREGMLTLSVGPTHAARSIASELHRPLGGGDRNAMSDRLEELQELTNLGNCLTDRAILALWLRLRAVTPPQTHSPAYAFDDVRTSSSAQQWARELLGRLPTDPLSPHHPDLMPLDLLKRWFDASGSAVAAQLGVTDRTVRNWIGDIGARLSRSLLGNSWADRHEVLLALLICDDELAQTVHDPAAQADRIANVPKRLPTPARPLRTLAHHGAAS
jgi:hypothetical protein